MDTVRIRNGMTNATEGDILGGFGDLLGNLGVVDLLGGHLLVTEDSPKGMTVQVAGGIAYVPNSNFDELNSDTPRFYPVVSSAEALTIDNNVSGDTRYDIVCVKIDKTISPDPDADNIATKVVIKGTSGGGVPATPANHYKLAEIRVVNGATEIENSMITDKREQIRIGEEVSSKTMPTGDIVGTTDTQTLTNKTLTSPLFGGTIDGWISAGETWTYASADDPTFTFTVGADVTTKYSAGMKIKLTQGTVKYFIITAVSTYSGGNTTITVYGGTDYDLADSAISANAYSMMKSPQGFPMSPAKWSVETTSTGTVSQSTPTASTWYNLGSITISVPIGTWDLLYKVVAVSIGGVSVRSSLSTSNNSVSDNDFTQRFSGVNPVVSPMFMTKVVSVASKTSYYLLAMSVDASTTALRFHGADGTTIIRATCAYL